MLLNAGVPHPRGSPFPANHGPEPRSPGPRRHPGGTPCPATEGPEPRWRGPRLTSGGGCLVRSMTMKTKLRRLSATDPARPADLQPTPPVDEGPLLDAYSEAVTNAVDATAPAVVHVQVRLRGQNRASGP